jgi:hypothetical protein
MARKSKQAKINVFLTVGLFIRHDTLYAEYKGSEMGDAVAKVSLVRVDAIEPDKVLIVCRPYNIGCTKVLEPYRCLA